MDHGLAFKDKIGIFLRIAGDDVEFYQQFFSDRMNSLKAEISPDICIELPEGKDGWAGVFLITSVR